MFRTKRLTETEKMQIAREAAEGVSTSQLAGRFGVTSRAVRYFLKADAERQADTAIPVAAVSVKVTVEELAALDAVLASAGIESRAEGLRRLIQAAGGVFVPDAQMAAEMARYRASLHEIGNGERAGELSAPFETDADREAFRSEIARVLDERQLDRLTSGDADALGKVLEDRLDRLYAAKVYLQSDASTANSEALRQVVDDLADTEYEKHRATDVDGETERAQTHG